MMTSLVRQRGASPVTWAALIALIALAALTAFKLIPLYIQDHTVKRVVEDVAHDPDNEKLSALQLWNKLDERLNINSVYDITREHYTYSRERGTPTITIAYEARKPLLGNVDLIATFSRSAVVKPLHE